MFASVLFLFSLLALSYGRGIDNSIITPRVVNGEKAQLGEIPFQVSLQYSTGQHFCGGSVLNAWYILTAAHCIRDLYLEAEDIYVAAGSVNLKEPYSIHHATDIKVHERYYTTKVINDIALIKVDRPFQFSNRLMPVQLPAFHEIVPTNTSVVVSGWGHLVSVESSAPDVLQKATILVADQEWCQRANDEKNFIVLPTNICANDPTIRRGQCSGDSGSPLSIGRKIVGIVSRSVKEPNLMCASTKYPGIYTRVSEYIDWINEQTKEEEWIWD